MAEHPSPMPRDSLPDTDTARNANLFLSSQVRIEAPAEHVFRILRDANTWKDWNTFCPEVSVEYPDAQHTRTSSDTMIIEKGALVTEQVRMKSDSNLRPQKVLVTSYMDTMEEKYSVGWEARGIPRVLLKSDRMNEVIPIAGQHACQYRTWEGMGGPLSYVVKAMYGRVLRDRFIDWASDLKGYAEKTWKQEGNH